jgi:hypothetical protein
MLACVLLAKTKGQTTQNNEVYNGIPKPKLWKLSRIEKEDLSYVREIRNNGNFLKVSGDGV